MKKNIDRLIKKHIQETLEEKAEDLISKIESNEQFDDERTKKLSDDKFSLDDYGDFEIDFEKAFGDYDSITTDEFNSRYIDNENMYSDYEDDEDEDLMFDDIDEGYGETCEECGSEMKEGVCEQCSEADMVEGNKFTKMLANARKGDKFTLNNKTYTDTSDYDINESIYIIDDNRGGKLKLTENEMIDLIEDIVNEELKKGEKPKGLAEYEKNHKKSGTQNSDYMKSLTKKMKEYLKDGSKGDFDVNPKHFPKGNGQLEKMNKKAYVPSDDAQEYVENFGGAGMENLDYDEIHPNDEWVEDNIIGTSKTGNNPNWANSEETEVNKKRNKIRKDNLLGKVKKKAYNKAPQPIVTDKTGEDKGEKLLTKFESIEPKKKEKLNEEFDRIRELLMYNRKTQ